MKKELDNKLCTKYPAIFKDRYAAPEVSSMCWGFECGDGWYNLLDELCSTIQNHIDHTKGVEQVVAVQVKEKFGGLRFYYRGGDEYVNHIAGFAENMSNRICEECGSPGKLYTKGWYKVRCDKCYKKEKQ